MAISGQAEVQSMLNSILFQDKVLQPGNFVWYFQEIFATRHVYATVILSISISIAIFRTCSRSLADYSIESGKTSGKRAFGWYQTIGQYKF